MKTKGKFIAILATLGLLLSMMAVLPTAGAVAGTVTLDDTVYSDNTGFNIVTVTVADADLSAARIGVARFSFNAATTADPTDFDITTAAAVLSGEKAKSDTFNGDANTVAFTMTKTARDADDDGILENADVTVTVGGSTLTATTGYTVVFATGVVTLAAAPPVGVANVVISYEISEYDQTTPGGTPVTRFGTSVLFGTSFTTATSDKSVDTIDNANGKIIIGSAIDLDGADNDDNTPDDNDSVVVTFVYDVADTQTKLVTAGSATAVGSGKTRQLDATEVTPSSNTFTNSVALFTAADLNKVESETSDASNDLTANGGDADGIVQVDELNNTTGLGTTLNTRVQAAATALGLTPSTATATSLVARSLPVADGDQVIVTYVDASPSGTLTDTASVDLNPPSVTLVQPVDKVYTGSTLVTMEARVVDSGAGVADTDITLVPPAGVAGSTLKAPIENGFAVSFAPSSPISEGAKTWFIAVKDKVGNTPVEDDAGTTANEGTRGAAPFGGTADNPFKFTVDTSAPTVSTATTGLYLKDPGVTTGTTPETQKTDNRSWVRLLFSLGTGGAPLDPASVAVSDFRVDGVAPISRQVNTVAQETGAVVVGSAVYLEVAQLATDARPKVELVGEVLDKAGNARTAGTITAAADKLTPVLTVTAAPSLDEKTVVVSIASTENLVVNPTVQTTTTEPASGGALVAPVTQSVTALGGRAWTSTYTNPTGAFSKQWVVVTGQDSFNNVSTVGDDTPDKDLVSFEVDDGAPAVRYPATTGTDFEGSVWITVRYDEDEYAGDSHKTVTVTSATLDGVDVAAELFSGSATTDEAGAALAGADAGDTHATSTLARTLGVGVYVFKITVKDDAGNSTSLTHTLTVKARPTFDLVLKPGVNLISIPGTAEADGTHINVLFSGLPVTTVVTYDPALELDGDPLTSPWPTSSIDPATGLFTGDIAALEPGKAYFVTASARTVVKLNIPPVGRSIPPLIQVNQGFNAVGFWSIEGNLTTATTADADGYLGKNWSVAYSFDPTPGVGWQVIRPGGADVLTAGMGYLVYFTQDSTLTP